MIIGFKIESLFALIYIMVKCIGHIERCFLGIVIKYSKKKLKLILWRGILRSILGGMNIG